MSTASGAAHWQRVARAQHGDDYARVYAERFAALAAEGQDVDGEARCVHALLPGPSRVLDAGCGTGRVGARLAELGHDVVGCDADPAMVEVARREHPHLPWHVLDLAGLTPEVLGGPVDLVLLAGNVVPLVEPGALPAVARACAAALAPGGAVVAGFGLDEEHLPPGCPPVALDDVESAVHRAGLAVVDRWSTWAQDPFDGGWYAVVVLRPA